MRSLGIMLRELSGFLGRAPSLGYMFAYVLLIPAFAFAYYLLPGQFLQSSLSQDIQMKKQTSELSSMLEEEIRLGIENKSFNGQENTEILTLNTDRISVFKIIADSSGVEFDVHLVFENGEDENKRIYFENLSFRLSYFSGYGMLTAKLGTRGYEVIARVEVSGDQSFPFDMRLILPFNPYQINDGLYFPTTAYWLPVSQITAMRLASLTSIARGVAGIRSYHILECFTLALSRSLL